MNKVRISIPVVGLHVKGYHADADADGIVFHDEHGDLAGLFLDGNETQMLAFINDIADYYGWEVSERDPGPAEFRVGHAVTLADLNRDGLDTRYLPDTLPTAQALLDLALPIN